MPLSGHTRMPGIEIAFKSCPNLQLTFHQSRYRFAFDDEYEVPGHYGSQNTPCDAKAESQ